jgi:hypothetical protein
MPVPARNGAYSGEWFPPPDGSQWGSLPVVYSDPHDVSPGHLRLSTASRESKRAWSRAIQNLVTWAETNDIHVSFYEGRRISSGETRYTDFMVYPLIPMQMEAGGGGGLGLGINVPYQCPGCSGYIQPWRENCAACGVTFACSVCHRHGFGVKMVETEDGHLACTRCVRRCNWIDPASGAPCGTAASVRLRRCSEHQDPAQTHHCAGCDQDFDPRVIPAVRIAGQHYDIHCTNGRCYTCGVVSTASNNRHPHRDHRDQPQCSACNARMLRWFLAAPVSIGRNTSATEYVIESLPNRPVRIMSFELEFCRHDSRRSDYIPGNDLARRLHDQGLSPYNQQMRYHCGMHEHPSHVENDSSVDGGELILNRLRLDQPEDAGHFLHILQQTQDMVGDRRLVFNARCGVHNHVDMHGYGILDARNLVTVYNYLEDVIYRFASAGYRDHRALINGSDYARPLLKGEWPTAKEFGVQYLQQANHRDSLNMEHFFKAWSLCRCGAIQYGNADECTCVRPKNTAEWRVFNGTNDPKILWAWAVFVQSITAWCQNRTLNVANFEPLGFEGGISFMDDTLGDAHHNLIDAWRSRLDWIFRNLVFTQREREGILDVMATTPLKHVGAGELARLRTLSNAPDNRVLQVPFIAVRRPPSEYENRLQTWYGRFDNDEEECLLCGEIEEYCGCPMPNPPQRVPNPPPTRRNRSAPAQWNPN